MQKFVLTVSDIDEQLVMDTEGCKEQSWSTDCEGLDLKVDGEELDWRADCEELNKGGLS